MFYPKPIDAQFSSYISNVGRRLTKLESIVAAKADSSILSRLGANILTNGTGLLESNKNFVGLTFDPAEFHGGVGSFRSPTYTGTETSDEYLPVEPTATYNYEVYVRNGGTGGVGYVAGSKFSIGLECYDSDKKLITPAMYLRRVGSVTTTLSAPLSPGDTTIHVTSATGWYTSGLANGRHITFSGYVSDGGHLYDDYTYSRETSANDPEYVVAGTWAAGGISGTTITLTKPWPTSLGSYAAGTKVWNGVNRDHYYIMPLAELSTCANTWTKFSNTLGTYNTAGTYSNINFPYGTAYVKPVLQYNQTTSGASWYFNMLSFAKVSASLTDSVTVSGFTFQAIQDAVDSCVGGETLVIPKGVYVDDGVASINISIPLTISGYGAVLQQTTAGKQCLEITGSGDVSIEGLTLVGPGDLGTVSFERAIHVVGNSAANPFINLKIENCTIYNWGQYGILLEWINTFHINNCFVYTIGYAGIMALSVKYGFINGNAIVDVVHTTGSNSYGIAVTKYTTDTLTVYPFSTDVEFTNNIVLGVTLWEGIDTHAGQRIAYNNNIVLSCKVGIAIVGAKDQYNVESYGAKEISVVGNIIDSLHTDGSYGAGILFVGPTPSVGTNLDPATGIIANNNIWNHGDESSSLGGAIVSYGTEGLRISGNVIRNPANAGIFAYHTNDSLHITDNLIVDPWRNSGATVVGIWAQNNYNTGYIGENQIFRGTLTGKTYYMTYGVRVTSNATNQFSIGINRITGYSTNAMSLGANAVCTTPVYSQKMDMLENSYLDINSQPIRGTTDVVMGEATTDATNGTTAVIIYTNASSTAANIMLTWAPYGAQVTPVGIPYVYTRTSTYFSIRSTSAADTNMKVAWVIFQRD